jgi:hypothetical protein
MEKIMLKMSKNINKCTTKHKSATKNYILKFLTVSSVSSDNTVKGIVDDIIKTAVKICLTQVLFNKRRMQVKCISLFNLTGLL